MLAWSEELITDVRKPKSWLWRHCRRRLFTDYSDHPRKLCHTKPKTQINRRRTLPASLSRWWDARKQRLKDFSPKSQDAVALQQIKERGALPLIVVISMGNRPCSNIWNHCRALVMVSSSIRLTAWLQNSKKRAERSERLMYMTEVTAIISALVICIIVCLSWAVNHYRDNAITYKAQHDKKYQRTEAMANAAITGNTCVSVMLLRSMQNTRRS